MIEQEKVANKCRKHIKIRKILKGNRIITVILNFLLIKLN